ncbi:MAG: HU family DNA-binding protein [Thermoguttaceae bacterium]|jgi:nucleoid DNA-binding protein
MTKKDIVRRIADELGCSQIETMRIVQKTFDAIMNVLAEEGRVELRNFGVFEVKKRKAPEGRNTSTDASDQQFAKCCPCRSLPILVQQWQWATTRSHQAVAWASPTLPGLDCWQARPASQGPIRPLLLHHGRLIDLASSRPSCMAKRARLYCQNRKQLSGYAALPRPSR